MYTYKEINDDDAGDFGAVIKRHESLVGVIHNTDKAKDITAVLNMLDKNDINVEDLFDAVKNIDKIADAITDLEYDLACYKAGYKPKNGNFKYLMGQETRKITIKKTNIIEKFLKLSQYA